MLHSQSEQTLQVQVQLVGPNLSDIYNKLIGRKSIHIAISKSSHIALKLECTKRELSMQEVIQYFAEQLELQNPKQLKFLDKIKFEKINKINNKAKTWNKTTINDIYDILEQDDKED